MSDLGVLTCPIQSRIKSPRQAKLPSALQGRFAPPGAMVRYTEVAKYFHGLSSYEAFLEAGIEGVVKTGFQNYPRQATALAYFQKLYTLFRKQVITLADGRTQTSELAGLGDAPVISGDFPDSKWGDTYSTLISTPINAGFGNNDVDSDTNAHFDDGSTAEMSAPQDLGAIVNDVEQHAVQPFPDFNPAVGQTKLTYGWDEAKTALRPIGPDSDPSRYTGAFGLFGGVGGVTIPGLPGAACGWAFGSAGLPEFYSRFRGQLILPLGNFATPYVILRVRASVALESGPDILGDPRLQAFSHIDIISTGHIQPGQVAGVDIPIPEPSPASFFATIGPDNNPVIGDYYFFGLGFADTYLNRFLNMHPGDNNILL